MAGSGAAGPAAAAGVLREELPPRSPRAAAPRGNSGVTTYEKRSSIFVASFVGNFVDKARDKARDKLPHPALSLAYLAFWRFATTTITTS